VINLKEARLVRKTMALVDKHKSQMSQKSSAYGTPTHSPPSGAVPLPKLQLSSRKAEHRVFSSPSDEDDVEISDSESRLHSLAIDIILDNENELQLKVSELQDELRQHIQLLTEANARLALEQNKKPASSRDTTGSIGLVVERTGVNNEYDVKSLTQGGSASTSSIKVGDFIVEVDGRAIASQSIEEVQSLILGTPGSTVTLTGVQNGVHVETLVRVSELRRKEMAREYREVEALVVGESREKVLELEREVQVLKTELQRQSDEVKRLSWTEGS
jgi:C-terminal processing protease CtpA/Prc